MVKTKKGISANTLSHPNSRKVRQLTKQVKKEEARKKSKMLHQMKLNLMGEKFIWFRDNLPPDTLELTQTDVCQLIQQYHGRFDEELEQIKLKHGIGQRKNRQHASREDVIKITKQQDAEEFKTSGIELPNLLLASQVELLRKWNGELRFLQNFKLRRFSEQFLKSGKDSLQVLNSNMIQNNNEVDGDNAVVRSESSSSEIMETDVEENKT